MPPAVPDAKTVFIGSDHAGFALKDAIISLYPDKSVKFEDLGTYSRSSCDYPEAAHKVCTAVLEHQARGILICGTGIGMSISANRFKGIRAGLCTHEFHARATRAHNDANVLCLGERITAPGLALELVKIFLETPFEGDRHQRRIELIENFE